MKKLLFLLLIPLFGCTCVLSQIPPQVIYVDENCQGAIPDYTLIVIASDNCGDVVLTQDPLPGTIMDINNPIENVLITATDLQGNYSQLSVVVTLVDTIPPILEWPAGQIAMGSAGAGYLWENLLAKVDADIAHFMYDRSRTQGMPFADSTQIEENLHWFTFNHRLTDDQLQEYIQYVESQNK